ncbi:MAG: CYTH domain-containing protein [Muribaculaceae bacterium]|nr:CYTH domain-containing protein [Muribaculaceae bacterium]
MSKEIERKYLVTNNGYESMAISSTRICQGYLSADPDATVRVRIGGNHAYITVKSRNHGAVRNEWEYEIPVGDAEDMIARCHIVCLEKTRYIVQFGKHIWEVDRFHGGLSGLVIAEIELSDAHETFSLPPFVGQEVTSNPEYFNSSLIKRLNH